MKNNFPDRRIVRSCPGSKYAGVTLIDFLSGRFDYKSREEWQEIIARGEFLANDSVAGIDTVLTAKSEVQWVLPEDLPEPETDKNYRILLEDASIIAVDKPGNLPTHPAGAYFHNTLWWLLRKRYGEIFPVNRLDRETSGIVLFARTASAAAELQKRMPEMQKEYILLVEGVFPDAPVRVQGWMRPDTASPIRKKQMLCDISESGKEAVTILRKIDCRDGVSKLLVTPVTGRMHQIRLAAYSLGYPVVGDKLYGIDENCFIRQKDGLTPEDFARLKMRRQALHAFSLAFPHPDDGRIVLLTTPQPEDFLF